MRALIAVALILGQQLPVFPGLPAPPAPAGHEQINAIPGIHERIHTQVRVRLNLIVSVERVEDAPVAIRSWAVQAIRQSRVGLVGDDNRPVVIVGMPDRAPVTVIDGSAEPIPEQ